ncbi:protein FATTY ACID EXPORT 4, chloroplastic [Ananas comosus]|uniref:Protein FATTY ACID EXPORT 4, chloroplastic n=1 Tax=Ananas comosus TaxID=4615 RepID=A0A6P5ER89_ANACO|nr:protein FATTY ACID EXPORT 4, chloroplastic [Ananas comosus]
MSLIRRCSTQPTLRGENHRRGAMSASPVAYASSLLRGPLASPSPSSLLLDRKSAVSLLPLPLRRLRRCGAQLLADLAPAASAAYGTLLLGGGLFAYLRSGSKGSILGGLSGSALMAVAYYLMQSPETKEVGDAIGFGSALLFASVFGIRLANTRKFVPSGLLLGLSLGVLAVFYSAYVSDKI